MCFSPYLGVGGGGGLPRGPGHNLLMQSSSLGNSKMGNSYHPQTVNHVFLYVFSPYLGVWGGGVPRGLGHNLLMQFSSLGSSKMKFLKLIFL